MRTVMLQDVIRRANTRVDKDNTDLLYYVGGEHFDSGEVRIKRWGEIAGSTIGPMFYYGFRKGNFLLVSRNPHLKKAGIADIDGICSEKTFVLESLDPDILLPEYLPFVLQNERFWNYAITHGHGSTNRFLNWSDLATYQFVLPEIEDQKVFAKLLWAIEHARDAYQQLLNSADELVQSQFVEMFGEEKNRRRLDELCTHFGDGDWIESKDQSESGIRLIQTGNVGNGEYIEKGEKARYINEETFSRLKCTEVKSGDILVSRLPDPIGRACIVPTIPKSITAVDCTIVRLKQSILPAFFVTFTRTSSYSDQINTFTTGTTRKRISRANLGSIMVPIPDIEQQKRFVAFADQTDKSKYLSPFRITEQLLKSSFHLS